MNESRALDYFLHHCKNLRAEETVLVAADARTSAIGEALARVACRAEATVTVMRDDGARNHGDEPTPAVIAKTARQMIAQLLTRDLSVIEERLVLPHIACGESPSKTRFRSRRESTT